MIDTEWREIPSYPEYEMNEKGEVRTSLGRNRLLVHTIPKRGLQISLWVNGQYVNRMVIDLLKETYPELKSISEPENDERDLPDVSYAQKLTDSLWHVARKADLEDLSWQDTAKAMVERVIKEGWRRDFSVEGLET